MRASDFGTAFRLSDAPGEPVTASAGGGGLGLLLLLVLGYKLLNG